MNVMSGWYSYLPAILSGVSAISSASAARKQGKYESAAFRTNAAYARINANDALARGQTSAMSAAVKARMIVGSQRAALAAQGIDISSGSALDVQVNTGHLSELDIMNIKNNAAREAWGYNIQASDYENRATLASMEASNKSRSTLLTGGLETLRLLG